MTGLNLRFPPDVTAATYSAPATTVSAFTITWTTNTPSASTAATVADGDAVTSAETGAILFNQGAQITALIADMVAMKAAVAQLAVDRAAIATKINS